MSRNNYCYHCGLSHDPEITPMVRLQTRSGVRMRCRKSLDAAKAARAERDAFGKAISERNSAMAVFRQRNAIEQRRLRTGW